jgi:hypothetical protein
LGSTPRSKTNWPEHIRKLKSSGYDGTITLEEFSPEQEHLLLSRDLLRRWWDEAVSLTSQPWTFMGGGRDPLRGGGRA